MCRRVVVMKNQWAISPLPSLLARHGVNKPSHCYHVECMINSGPFGHRFKLGDTPDVEKAGRHCFDLGFWHSWLLWSGGILQSPLHGLVFGLGIMLITPCFITSDDTIQKITILMLFRKVHAQSETSVLLFLRQVSRQDLQCWLSHAKIL
jgi:hypothetical protein